MIINTQLILAVAILCEDTGLRVEEATLPIATVYILRTTLLLIQLCRSFLNLSIFYSITRCSRNSFTYCREYQPSLPECSIAGKDIKEIALSHACVAKQYLLSHQRGERAMRAF